MEIVEYARPTLNEQAPRQGHSVVVMRWGLSYFRDGLSNQFGLFSPGKKKKLLRGTVNYHTENQMLIIAILVNFVLTFIFFHRLVSRVVLFPFMRNV
jgi:hypothetical protein